MTKDDKPDDLMGYAALHQEALRGVIRAALTRAARPDGLPGDHHLYISFRTDAADVVLPQDLLARYPEEMTIVLQHQYRDLKAGESAFSVTLQFSGQPKNIVVPYVAVTRFYDPSVQYVLQWAPPTPGPTPGRPSAPKSKAPTGDAAPKIVSLDQFRKK